MSSNHLSGQTSPYLLQHKDHPVDWYPWGDDAFQKAQAENKPIFLSIGYAACHWCHVMAHESFEDPEIAALLNENFVAIKVDREERPDIDSLYQHALSLLRSAGGWPLSMFLTSSGEPFFGGTYFPNEDRYGRPSFRAVLTSIKDTYRQQTEKVQQTAQSLTSALQAKSKIASLSKNVVEESLDSAAEQLLPHIDPAQGGLKGAPKFPMTPLLTLLWKAWARTGKSDLRDSVLMTLEHICQGGIYDHLGGGFCRYATDDQWLIPHFEKMLYDNASLVSLMSLCWQETRFPLFKLRVAETLRWAEQEMLSPEGAFYSAIDADSEGEEGKFYLWTGEEISHIFQQAKIPPAQSLLFKEVYDVSDDGNWEDSVILNRNHRLPSLTAEDEIVLARLRDVLFVARQARPRPMIDTKILTDWNGLMISALCKAALCFERPDWLERAEKTFAAILSLLSTPEGRLSHCWCRGEKTATSVLEDYTHMGLAALALYQATGKRGYLTHAQSWCQIIQQDFADGVEGWFQTPSQQTDLIARPKSLLDPASAGGTGAMISLLAQLFWITGEDRYRQSAETVVFNLAGQAFRQIPSSCGLFNGYDDLTSVLMMVLVSPAQDATQSDFISEFHKIGSCNGIIVHATPNEIWPSCHPAYGKGLVDGQTTAYLCQEGQCFAAITDPQSLLKAIPSS